MGPGLLDDVSVPSARLNSALEGRHRPKGGQFTYVSRMTRQND